MNENAQNNRIRKWAKRLVWLVVGLLLLGVFFRLSLRSNWMHNWARDIVVTQANKQLNAKLSIERLDGDLWNEVRISKIRLTGDDTLASVDSLHAAYNIWALLGGHLEVSELGIYRPHLQLKQQQGQWNVENVIVSDSATAVNDSGNGISFAIASLQMKAGSVSVQSDSLPVEPNFSITDLSVQSSLGYTEPSYQVDIEELSFSIENTGLENPLKVQTSVSASNDNISLEQLVMGTGNSMIQSSAFVNPVDSSIQFNLNADPISWRDVVRYARDVPLQQDMHIEVGLDGRPEEFSLSVNMRANGLEALTIDSRFHWRSSLILKHLKAEVEEVNTPLLLSDTTLPSFQHMRAEFNGQLDFVNYKQATGDLSFSAGAISKSPYDVDAITGEVSVEKQNASINLFAKTGKQKLRSDIELNNIWDDQPLVQGTLRADNIDPAHWTQDTTYAGNINARAEFSGRGWYPDERPWTYSVEITDSKLFSQPVKELAAKGKLSGKNADVEATLLLRDEVIDLLAEFRDMASTPKYSYSLKTRDLDVGPFLPAENFSTSLNAVISGDGQGFDPSSMQLNSSVSVDSSLVNGELIRTLAADVHLRDSVAVVDSAKLLSTIAEGSFDFRFNMLRHLDVKNELAIDVELKDIHALAPLFGVDTLQAQGQLTGNLSPTDAGNLQFLGEINLAGIQYNNLFVAQKAQGKLDLRLEDNLRYLADLELTAPIFSGLQIQDMAIKTEGRYADSTANGSFEFNFSSPTEGRIEQRGSYQLAKDSVTVRTTEFNIISDFRTLTLEEPFNLYFEDNELRVDTMRVSSGDDAFFEMAIPLANAIQQRGYIRGNALNTAVIQSCLLGEAHFKGMLSGQFNFNREQTNLQAEGELLLSELVYNDTRFDTLRVNGDIKNDRMQGTLLVREGGKELISGQADLPFRLGNPEEFPDSFFEEQVTGKIKVRNVAIESYQPLFDEAGVTNTTGVFSFTGTLKGRAGEPEFVANASLKKAKLSGVTVDSVTAGLNYSHQNEQLQLEASVSSLRQKAAQVNAKAPLYINMKAFEVDLPEAQDSIAVDVTTNNFNLAALNDFLDRRRVREIKGKLDGMVHIGGVAEDLKTDGTLSLKQGAFRLVPAGIRVDKINSKIVFDPNQIRLENFSAQSGGGGMTANGVVELEKLMPGDINITVKASNFRAANTSQYNAIINLNARAQGQVSSPKVTGNLSFVSGFLELQNFGENSVETIELESAEATAPQVSVYDSLALDMDIAFNRRFFIRNQRYLEMEVELDGSLDLLKDKGKDLQLFGTMNAPSGYARPLGKDFSLQEGAVTFTGQPDNPQLMIRSEYQPPNTQEEVTIWYIIEGTVEDPKFKYESQPPMELENILSYTLFGQPFYALDSWKQVVAGSGRNATAANVALDVLLDRVEALATQKLGIDVVKIDNSNLGGETGTSITTGWYVNPKVFFAIQNVITGSTPDTGFLLEYSLRKNLKLILRQGNGISQGADVKWNYDY